MCERGLTWRHATEPCPAPRLDGIARIRAAAAGPGENLHQEIDQPPGARATGVEPRVVDRELHPERSRMARERSEESGQLVDAGAARGRRIYRRHDPWVEDVRVEMDPEAREAGASDPVQAPPLRWPRCRPRGASNPADPALPQARARSARTTARRRRGGRRERRSPLAPGARSLPGATMPCLPVRPRGRGTCWRPSRCATPTGSRSRHGHPRTPARRRPSPDSLSPETAAEHHAAIAAEHQREAAAVHGVPLHGRRRRGCRARPRLRSGPCPASARSPGKTAASRLPRRPPGGGPRGRDRAGTPGARSSHLASPSS